MTAGQTVAPRPLIVLVPKYFRLGQGFSRLEQRQAMLAPPRRVDGTQSRAAWITTLVDQRKLVMLCRDCAPRFDTRRARYRPFYSVDATLKTDGYRVSGHPCDDCTHRLLGGRAFVAEEVYAAVCTEPADARRHARWAARAGVTVRTYLTRWLAGLARAQQSRKD
jgi:hypothetical protein